MKLNEVVGSKLRAFSSLTEWNKRMFSSLLQFWASVSGIMFLVEYLCSNRSESKVVIKYPGALQSITFFQRPSLLSLKS